MSWIDRLKREEAQSYDRARDETRLRLHNAAVVQAKMPAFWTHLRTCIGTSCIELRQAFPDNPHRHCTLDNVQGDRSFRLINTIPPRVSLIVEYNANGQCIDITDTRDSVQRPPEQYNITTTNDEEIVIKYGRETITAAAELAEHLCRRVAQIPH
jgi:hypothetical protein